MATPVIDKNNPWPWLDPFTEKAEAFFNGREDDSAALERCVVSGTATVLFGKSGLGKTSLLQAGLFPRLRKGGLLPVLVRLIHGGDSPPAAAQIRARLHQESTAHGLAIPGNSLLAPSLEAPEDRLWLDLHTSPVGLRDEHGGSWQPVFVLDQFEEIFTLGGQDAVRQQRDFGILGDLIENRIPNAVEGAISDDEDLLDVLLLDAQAYRVILSLREDYLPNLERWCDRIPRLGPNRYRLLPMQEAQALDAIRLTGGDLVTAEDAQRIVHFVASQQEGPSSGVASGECAEVSIEPALLSLLCSGLNLERQATGAPRLDAADLEQRGGRIMERFYDDATKGVAPTAVAFVEDELITPDGVRLFYPLKSILQNTGISKSDIDTLIERRLLRRQPFVEGERIEVVHDRLAAVARQRRKNRESVTAQQRLLDEAHREAEAKEANVRADLESKAREVESRARQRAELDATAQRRLQQKLKYVVVALILLLALAGGSVWIARQQGELARFNAEKARQSAEEATIRRLIAEGQAMASGRQSGGSINGMLQMLAAHRLAANGFPQASANALGALQAEFLRTARLVRIMDSDEAITALAVSPDESRVVTGGRSGSLRFWDAEGKPLGKPMKGHVGHIQSLAFSPDGKTIVSAGKDDISLRLWNVESGSAVGEILKGHKKPPRGVAFSPDGKMIVSASLDQTLRRWDAATGQAIGEPLAGHSDGVASVAFSPDGKLIVSGSYDNSLRLWNALTGQAMGEPLTGHEDVVGSVAFSPDGRLVVSGSADATLRLWDVATGKPIGDPLRRHRQAVHSVAFSPDGKLVVSGSGDHAVRLWDVDTRKQIGESLKGHTDEVTGVTFSRDGTQIYSSSFDMTLRRWIAFDEISGGRAFKGASASLQSVAFSPAPDGKMIASGGRDELVHRWDANTGAAIGKPLAGHAGAIYSMAFSPDGKRIASAGEDMALRQWDADSGAPIGSPLVGHGGTIYGVAFSPDGTRLLSAGEDSVLRLWDVASGAAIGPPLAGHQDIVYGVAFFPPDGRVFVSASGDRTLRRWDGITGAAIGQPLEGHGKTVNSVAVSRVVQNTQRIVSGSDDMTLRLWDAASGASIGKPLSGHTHFVNSVAFSPDGRHIVSGSKDRTVRLWDASTGAPVGAPLEGHTDSIFSVVFSPDGKHVASAAADTTVRRWPVLESWADALCAKLSRNLTKADWQRLVSPEIAYIKQCPNLPDATE